MKNTKLMAQVLLDMGGLNRKMKLELEGVSQDLKFLNDQVGALISERDSLKVLIQKEKNLSMVTGVANETLNKALVHKAKEIENLKSQVKFMDEVLTNKQKMFDNQLLRSQLLKRIYNEFDLGTYLNREIKKILDADFPCSIKDGHHG